MNRRPLDGVLCRFRRQVVGIRALRIGLLLLLLAGILGAASFPEPTGKRLVLMLIAAAIVVWVLLIVKSIHVARQLQTGTVLLSLGRLDDAETWLCRAMEHFSFSVRSKMVACQELASLFFHRDAYQEVVAICRALLRHRVRGLRQIVINVRLLLGDSLLMLDQVAEAYEAIRPVYDLPLSLADRMKLLPIRLRYELAADHAASSVQSLNEKVRMAELLDARRAALVHALLAEACRRQSMPAKQTFLIERARLYHDLDDLVARYPIIAPVAGWAVNPIPEGSGSST